MAHIIFSPDSYNFYDTRGPDFSSMALTMGYEAHRRYVYRRKKDKEDKVVKFPA